MFQAKGKKYNDHESCKRLSNSLLCYIKRLTSFPNVFHIRVVSSFWVLPQNLGAERVFTFSVRRKPKTAFYTYVEVLSHSMVISYCNKEVWL